MTSSTALLLAGMTDIPKEMKMPDTSTPLPASDFKVGDLVWDRMSRNNCRVLQVIHGGPFGNVIGYQLAVPCARSPMEVEVKRDMQGAER